MTGPAKAEWALRNLAADLKFVVTEDDLRAEFECQHADKNLNRYMDDVYWSVLIEALWQQHVRTAQWLGKKSAEALAKGSEP